MFTILTDPAAKAVFAGADYVVVDPADETALLPLSAREYKRQLNVAKSNDFSLTLVKVPGRGWNWDHLMTTGWLGSASDRQKFYGRGGFPAFNRWYETSGRLVSEKAAEESSQS